MTTTATIAGRVEQLQAGMAGQLPQDVQDTFARDQAQIVAAGAPAGVAQPGTVLSDAQLMDVNGEPTSLYAVTAGRPTVVVFYRGAWCPYCNIALSTYGAELAPRLADRGLGLLAVSPQTPDGSLSMQQKHELTFAVASDPGAVLIRELGVRTAPSDDVLAAQHTLGLDITEVNADATTSLPMPTVLILDGEHVLRWIDVHPDYTTRTEPTQVLDALDHLGL